MTAINYYFCGGELEAFSKYSHSSTTSSTTSDRFDSNFARCAVGLEVDSSTAYISSRLSAAQTDCWYSVRHFYRPSNVGVGMAHSEVWMMMVDGDGIGVCRVIGAGGTPAQPLIRFQYWSGVAWTNTGSLIVCPTTALHRFDFRLLMHNSAGVLGCYLDDTLLGELTGDTIFNSAGSVLEMRYYIAWVSGSGGGSTYPWISEVFCQDITTRRRRLATLSITGAGATNSWGGSYADIDDLGTYSDTDFVDSDTANEVSTYVASDLSAAAQVYSVDAVVLGYRAKIGATGPQNIKGVLRIGGTDYPSSANVSGLVGEYGYVISPFTTNPATAGEFTAAEINTAGFEVGLKSIT